MAKQQLLREKYHSNSVI